MTHASNAAKKHLSFLWPSIQRRSDVLNAQELCGGLSDTQLAHLLRHHEQEAISDLREIERRATFDYALQAYGLLTVAVISGYVPADLGEEPRGRIARFLGREAVRVYYEQHYPILLPSLLRLHASGAALLLQEEGEFSWGCFQWLARFSTRFEKDTNLETFVNLLDGFVYGELGIDAFLNGLQKPTEALSGITKPPDQLTRRECAVLGMLRFLTFCRELAPALASMKEAPLTQSACWFYYAYWFKGFAEDVGSRAEQCLSILEHWIKTSADMSAAAALEGERIVADTRLAIQALVDGRYAGPLVNRQPQDEIAAAKAASNTQQKTKLAARKVPASAPKLLPAKQATKTGQSELDRIVGNFTQYVPQRMLK